MKRLLICVFLVACGGATQPKPHAVDPFTTIHVVSQLDTATAMGRSTWYVYSLIFSSDPNLRGFGFQGSISLVPRPDLNTACAGYDADNIGQRQEIVLAIADTVHAGSNARADSIAQAWFAGSRTVPSGWAKLVSDSIDWGVSAQFNAGHGLTRDDPIRWRLTWTMPGTVTASEAPTDLTCRF